MLLRQEKKPNLRLISMQYKLSFLIPARNEMWLARTVQDLLDHTSDQSEIIVGIDSEHAGDPVPEHPRVTVLRTHIPIGQRAMTKQLGRLSKAKYICKADAHTSYDQDWDVKMLKAFEETGDDVTMVSVMRNLHVFDWVCKNGHRRYQSPSGPCTECGEPTERDVVWFPKPNPASTSYRFDTELHFQYFREWKRSKTYKEQLKTGLTDTMSLQGSLFMMTRDRYFDLDMDDEAFGSWGAQGSTIACKTWLSGGRCVVNHNTWYAHLFRTQGGDFSFPYKQDNKQVEQARERSRRLFLDNTWEHQTLPLSWLVDKFEPVPDWHDGKDNGMLAKIREWGKKMV